jgi:opacity protein-like surface antigen
MKCSRTPWAVTSSLALLFTWLAAQPAHAQTPSGQDDTVYEDEYDEGEPSAQRYAFGFGAGIVLPNFEGNEDGEIYYSANFRWRLFDRSRNSGRDTTSGSAYNERHNSSHDRGRYPGASADSGIRGYLEPEIGYWQRSEEDAEVDDLMVGVNLVGVVPTRSADFFVGVGFALHQLDADLDIRNGAGEVVDTLSVDDTRFGATVHVGVELHLSESVGVFGTGRLDILDDEPFDRQTKIWGGIRFHF